MSYKEQIKNFPMIDDMMAASNDDLIKSHLRLVTSIVRKTYGQDNPFYDDLVQIGNLALVRAANSFDRSLNIQFASYAMTYIKYDMAEFMLNNRTPFRVYTTKAMRKVANNIRAYRDVNGMINRDQMISDLNVTLNDVRMVEERQKLKYIDVTQPSLDDDEYSVEIPDYGSDPMRILSKLQFEKFLMIDVKNALSALDDRERFIIENRYFKEEPMTVKDIGSVFGVSFQRIGQIEQKALKKMRTLLDKSNVPATIED